MEYQNIIYQEVPTDKYDYYVPRNGDSGSISKRRPGKEPTLPDAHLTPEELQRRNNRRRRNREAAARVRERRLGKMQKLEEQVEQLKFDQKDLQEENEALRKEVMKLRRQIDPNVARPLHRLTRQISNTEAPPPEEMPIVPKQENLNDVFQQQPTNMAIQNGDNNKPTVLFTPGGTFVLTPIRQDVRFDFPETTRARSVSDGEYKKILLNL